VREVVRDAKAQHYRFSAIVTGIVNSDAFRLQGVKHAPESDPKKAPVQASLGDAGTASP